MTQNELLTLMAAVIWSSDRGGKYNLGYAEAVNVARRLLHAGKTTEWPDFATEHADGKEGGV